MTLGEIIGTAIRFLFGFGFMFALVSFMLWRNSYRWRKLAEAYQSSWNKPNHLKRFQYGVLYGGDAAFNAFKGILMIGVHKDGIAMKPWGPFGLFHPALFVPYNDIRGWKQLWYLNTESVELQFTRAPAMKLVMPKEQVEWIQQVSGTNLAVSEEQSPHKDKPIFWYTILIILFFCTLASVGFLLFQYLF